MFNTLAVSLLLISSIFVTSCHPKKYQINPRIIRGEDAQPGQIKHMVSLRQIKRFDYGREDYNHFCGATLISERWVVSAAHCLKDDRLKTANIRIVVGANHFWRDGDMYKVKKIIRHEDFNPTFQQNDISLLQTKVSIIFSEYVQRIQIAKKWIEPGQDGIFAGFGVTGMFKLKSNK